MEDPSSMAWDRMRFPETPEEMHLLLVLESHTGIYVDSDEEITWD